MQWLQQLKLFETNNCHMVQHVKLLEFHGAHSKFVFVEKLSNTWSYDIDVFRARLH